MENLNIYIRFPKENEYENGLLCDVVANIFQEKIILDSSVNLVNWLPRGPAYQIVHGCQNRLPIRLRKGAWGQILFVWVITVFDKGLSVYSLRCCEYHIILDLRLPFILLCTNLSALAPFCIFVCDLSNRTWISIAEPLFSRRHFQMDFLELKCMNFDINSTEVCS